MNITSALIIAFTIVFSPFAGIIAYIVMYDEYQHHLDPKSAKRQALNMALFAFLVFVAVGIISGFAFSKVISK